MLTFTVPSPLAYGQLRAEIEAAGYQDVEVILTERSVGRVKVDGRRSGGADIDDADEQRIGEVVAAHVPTPLPDPVADLMAALGPADTVAKVKAALTTHLPRALGRNR